MESSPQSNSTPSPAPDFQSAGLPKPRPNRWWLWLIGAVALILLVLWFSRTGTLGLGGGVKSAYYGSFKQLGLSGIDYQLTASHITRYQAQSFTMADGQILFYHDAYDPDWGKNFSAIDPKGNPANSCIVPKIYKFDPQTEEFTEYQKTKIINPLLAQVSLLPNGKLFVLGFAVPVGWCNQTLPAYEWQFQADYSRNFWLAMVYDLETGEHEEIKVNHPPIVGMDRIPGNLRTGSQISYDNVFTGLYADSPVVINLPNRGLLISTTKVGGSYGSSSATTDRRTYIYDYKKGTIEFYDQDTGLPNLNIDTATLPLTDGRTVLYDNEAKALKVFNPRSLKVDLFREAHLALKQYLHFWQLDADRVLIWQENGNSDLVAEYQDNFSTLYLYDLKTNLLYQREVGDLPLKQYANQSSDPAQPAALQELAGRLKKFRIWPLTDGILLVAGYSYQNLPWSFGLFNAEDLSLIPAVNQTDLDQLRPEARWIGKTITNSAGQVTREVVGPEHNIAFPIPLKDGRILFVSSDPTKPQYALYQPNSRSTTYQLRHRLTNLAGWTEVKYRK